MKKIEINERTFFIPSASECARMLQKLNAATHAAYKSGIHIQVLLLPESSATPLFFEHTGVGEYTYAERELNYNVDLSRFFDGYDYSHSAYMAAGRELRADIISECRRRAAD